MPVSKKHTGCKRTVKRRLDRLNYIVQCIRDMYNDNCPIVPKIARIDNVLSEADKAIHNLKYEILYRGL